MTAPTNEERLVVLEMELVDVREMVARLEAIVDLLLGRFADGDE